MIGTPRLFVVVGGPGSGKDLLIQVVRKLGIRYAGIVTKHTSRTQRFDEQEEMLFPGDEGYDLAGCDVKYDLFDATYGFKYSDIWKGLKEERSQVLVVSKAEPINSLRELFGGLLVLAYVHSDVTAEVYVRSELGQDHPIVAKVAYLAKHTTEKNYDAPFQMYLDNMTVFDHVLLHIGPPEDLYDQGFELFLAYKRGDI